jgi:hypothetical protein
MSARRFPGKSDRGPPCHEDLDRVDGPCRAARRPGRVGQRVFFSSCAVWVVEMVRGTPPFEGNGSSTVFLVVVDIMLDSFFSGRRVRGWNGPRIPGGATAFWSCLIFRCAVSAGFVND